MVSVYVPCLRSSAFWIVKAWLSVHVNHPNLLMLGNYSAQIRWPYAIHPKLGCGGAPLKVATSASKILAPCLCMVAQYERMTQ